MKKITTFEDLIAWQKARELTREIYTVTKSGEFKKDFGLRDQIQRACVSIMSNIAEGFDRASRAEFHQFLTDGLSPDWIGDVLSQKGLSVTVDFTNSRWTNRRLSS